MAEKNPPRDEGELGPAAQDTRFDRDVGAVLGKGGKDVFRFATGRGRPDVSDVGPEMLRNRHPGRSEPIE